MEVVVVVAVLTTPMLCLTVLTIMLVRAVAGEGAGKGMAGLVVRVRVLGVEVAGVRVKGLGVAGVRVKGLGVAAVVGGVMAGVLGVQGGVVGSAAGAGAGVHDHHMG
jgi:hypothetical protein